MRILDECRDGSGFQEQENSRLAASSLGAPRPRPCGHFRTPWQRLQMSGGITLTISRRTDPEPALESAAETPRIFVAEQVARLLDRVSGMKQRSGAHLAHFIADLPERAAFLFKPPRHGLGRNPPAIGQILLVNAAEQRDAHLVGIGSAAGIGLSLIHI